MAWTELIWPLILLFLAYQNKRIWRIIMKGWEAFEIWLDTGDFK